MHDPWASEMQVISSQSQALIYDAGGPYIEALANDIIRRTDILYTELSLLEERIESVRKDVVPGLAAFIRDVGTEQVRARAILKEYRSLDRNNREDVFKMEQLVPKLEASNLCFFEAVWRVAKRCQGLEGVRHFFHFTGPSGKRDSATVDLVMHAGAEWIRVIHTKERRILRQIAGATGYWDHHMDIDDDNSDGHDENMSDSEDNAEVALVKAARNLVAAARVNHSDFGRPRVRMVLTNICEGSNEQIDELLEELRAMGGEDVSLTVECFAGDDEADQTPLEDILQKLVVTIPKMNFSSEINLCSSVLVSLLSDCSHVPTEKWLKQAEEETRDGKSLQALRDIANEELKNGPWLQRCLYLALGDSQLVCTRNAAQSIRKIARDIGTESEVARTKVLFGEEPFEGTAEERRQHTLSRWQELSAYPVPLNFQLPVQIVDDISKEDVERLVREGKLPKVAIPMSRILKSINVSIFMSAWAAGRTTLTSNRAGYNKMKNIAERYTEDSSHSRPQVYVVPFWRQFFAKPRPTNVVSHIKEERLANRERERREMERLLANGELREPEKKGTKRLHAASMRQKQGHR